MKNTQILPPVMLLLLSAGTLQAQYSHLYYHRTGDTIQYYSPIYYHNRWGFNPASESVAVSSDYVILSLFHGFCVDFSVPFLVTFFCSL